MKIYILFLFVFINTVFVQAQDKKHQDAIDYIEKYKDIAMAEMKRAKIPASITLAQGLYESGFGKSYLAMNTNNHFGIKCHETWTGKTFKYTDDAPNECFRVYESVEQSYIDHSEFLVNRKRYANLFLLDIKDYKAWAYGLKSAGYATNPKYPENLIKYIELYELYKYDEGTYISYQPKDELKEKTDQFLSTPIVVEPPKEKKTEFVEINISNKQDHKQNHKNENKVNSTVVNEKKLEQPNTNVSTKPKTKKIYEHNNLKAVKIYSQETLAQIADAMKINVSELMKFNDINDENISLDNQYLYIENKKSKSKTPTHKVKANDNMWSISQKYGVQLISLLKMNQLELGEEPKVGTQLVLKGKNKNKPELRILQNDTEKKIPEQNIIPFDEKTKITSTIKDTTYPKLIEKHTTSVDSNTILSWEESNKLLDKKPVQPFIDQNTKQNTNVDVKEINSSKENINQLATEKIIEQTVEKVNNTNQQIEKNIVVPQNNTTTPKPENGKHLVAKGDTLYNISNRYGITIANLIEWNNIENNIIKLGTYLKIAP